ncbi:zinc finger protein Gfi-1b-like [Toxorhynchites rutilus septentrionalis]|uniref:zinc finger protein Gfi-1b-like n=1 Tax=Toxorhynchites rutilus septentrionalis TaxID=329112 RepID=UPI0024786713|nr:zinc finger protein Gfi-1b-like [Toxorhynchites rutilus septentrionalis]
MFNSHDQSPPSECASMNTKIEYIGSDRMTITETEITSAMRQNDNCYQQPTRLPAYEQSPKCAYDDLFGEITDFVNQSIPLELNDLGDINLEKFQQEQHLHQHVAENHFPAAHQSKQVHEDESISETVLENVYHLPLTPDRHLQADYQLPLNMVSPQEFGQQKSNYTEPLLANDSLLHQNEMQAVPLLEQQPPLRNCQISLSDFSGKEAPVSLSSSRLKTTRRSVRRSAVLYSEFQCDECGSYSKSRAGLKQHKKWIHFEGRFTCRKCGKRYETAEKLDQHVKNHSQSQKSFKCDICQKQYMHKSDLRRHQFYHSADGAPFQCSLCGKGFSRSDNLIRHKKTHWSQQKSE